MLTEPLAAASPRTIVPFAADSRQNLSPGAVKAGLPPGRPAGLPPGRPAVLTALSLPGYGGNSGRGGGGNNYSGGASYNTGSHGGYGGGSGGGGSSYQGKQGQYTTPSLYIFPCEGGAFTSAGALAWQRLPDRSENPDSALKQLFVSRRDGNRAPLFPPPRSAGGYSSQSNYNSPGSGQNYSGPPSSYQASQGGYGRNDHSMNYQYR